MQLFSNFFNLTQLGLSIRRQYVSTLFKFVQIQLKMPYKYNCHLLNSCSKRYFSAYLENRQLKSVLLSYGLTEDNLNKMLEMNSELLKYPIPNWDIIKIFIKHGFPTNVISDILIKLPNILEIKSHDLNKTITKWRELKLDDEMLIQITTGTPMLLLLTDEYIDERVKQIFDVFTSTDLFKLLEHCPLIFLEDWNSILEKIRYIQESMGFTQIQIVRGSVLEQTLLHIKTRHMLCVLCGRFKRPTPKKKILTNPSLKMITDSTNEEFVKMCGLSLEEYYIFSDIMRKLDKEDEYELLFLF